MDVADVKIKVEKAVLKARGVPKRITAGIAIGLFELFITLWPDAISEHWQTVTYKGIGFIGATGIVDWGYKNRKEAWAWVKKIFRRKGKEAIDESKPVDG